MGDVPQDDGLIGATRCHGCAIFTKRYASDLVIVFCEWFTKDLAHIDIPQDDGFEVDVVGEKLNGYSGKPVDPNLEHGYVYFMEYKL